ncbi:hypothetical protein ABL78_3473 [Leptomonas seymouri]|uniref:Uncharacterized protein n=1 Tax=Leptomonas seymouri TaxID=5684 RepID=A0A0N1ILA9_LEPSE|nr:hypothetical protein ABL78_3473 [Leptomonas seymouri]|eukprot:KPI87442.1 hypothetical protein ABL78_3473 [Leptomonas seymouri]
MSDSDSGTSAGASGSPANVAPAPSQSPGKASAIAAHNRHSGSPLSTSGPVTVYQHPFYRSKNHAFDGTAPSPSLHISTRRLQIFSYVLAELSSAATVLPDYTRAVLNLSRRLIGAWQAITAAAIERTRYEHMLIWATYRHRQQPFSSHSSSSTARASAATLHEAPAGSLVRRQRGAKRRGTPSSFSTTSGTTSAAASLFNAAASAASSHKRRRLVQEEGSGARRVRPVSALKLRRAVHGKDAAAEQWREGARWMEALPPRLSTLPAAGRTMAGGMPNARVRRSFTPPLLLSLSGAAEHRARELVVRHRERLLLSTLQQLWLDAQEKEDKAGQHIEYLRGLIINAIFQQYLGVTVEQSYNDLVLYRWLTPVLVSAHDGAARGGEDEGGVLRGTRPAPAEETARPQSYSFFSSSPPLAGELEHGSGGAVRRARRRQAAAHVAQDLKLLRQVLQRARITAAPTVERRVAPAQKSGRSMKGTMGSRNSGSTVPSTLRPPSFKNPSASSAPLPKKRQRSPSTSPSTLSDARLTREEKETEKAVMRAAEPAGPSPSGAHEAAASVLQSVKADTLLEEWTGAADSTPPDAKEAKSHSLLGDVPRSPTCESGSARGASRTCSPSPHPSEERPSLTAAQAGNDGAPFDATLHWTDHPQERSPLVLEGLIAAPLPLQLFLQACTSFDPTHCAFSLMSRCVVFAHHIHSEDEEQLNPANSATSSPSKYNSSGEQPSQRRSAYDDRQQGITGGEEGLGSESKEEYADLFYVVIARRAVGACEHTALCFGNQKFIFVRCRDTEALIREVMLYDDEEAEEEDEGYEHAAGDADAAAQESRQGNAVPAMETRGSGAASMTDDLHAVYPAQGSQTEHQTEASVSVDGETAERSQTCEKEATGRSLHDTPRTPSYCATREKDRMQADLKPESERCCQDFPRLPPPSPALRSHSGITALTERDARRLQVNASPDRSTSRGDEGNQLLTTADCQSNDAMLCADLRQLPPSSASAAARARFHTPIQPHTAPVFRALLPDAARRDSIASSNASYLAVTAAARRWSRHMRQAAWAGPRGAPPPFVSTDAMDLQLNPGFAEPALMPLPPLPFAGALHSSTANCAVTAPPSQDSPAHASSFPLKGLGPRNSQDPATSRTAAAGRQPQLQPPRMSLMPVTASPAEQLLYADVAETQLYLSVHSPLHLTPLAYHARLHPGPDDRPRVPPPLELSASTQRYESMSLPTSSSAAASSSHLGKAAASTTTTTTAATSLPGEHRVGEEAKPLHEPVDATIASRSTGRALSPGLPRVAGAGEWQSDTATDDESENLEEREGISSDDDAQPLYVIMHSSVCSCVRGMSDVANSSGDDKWTHGIGGDTVRTTSFVTPPLHPGTAGYRTAMPSTMPRASVFPSSRHFSEASGGLDDNDFKLNSDTATYGDFPLSYFEQQVLLPPGSGQERRSSGHNNKDLRQPSVSAPPAAQSSSARQASAPHLFHMADPLHGTAAGERREAVSDERDEEVAGPEGVDARAAKMTRTDTAAGRLDGGAGHREKQAARRRHEEAVSPLPVTGSTPDVCQREQQRQDGYSTERAKGNATADHEPSSNVPASCCFSPPPHQPAVEPTEGDMAFAAELYSRLEFWCLRGQDRSAYIDPSWWRTSACSVECDELNPQTTANNHEEGKEVSCASKQQVFVKVEGEAADGPNPSPPSSYRMNHRGASASTGSGDEEDGPTTHAAVPGIVCLPLKLLDYAVGTIELADGAYLSMQQRKRRAGCRKGRGEKGACAAADRDCSAAGARRTDGGEGGGGCQTDAESDISDAWDAEDDEGSGETARDGPPDFTPLMTVDARGKELLFEALLEATDVVVCAVRESRAHAGYHDLLHQRYPPMLSSPSSPSTQSSAAKHSNGSAFNSAAPTMKSGALTTVNPWAIAAAAAAARGFTFPVTTGTLSHDERCPFTFDRHQHLGTYGTVRWSQGHVAVAGRGADDAAGSVAVTDMPESLLSLPSLQTYSSSASYCSFPARGRGSAAVMPSKTGPKHAYAHSEHTPQPSCDARRGSCGAAGAATLSSSASPSHAWRWPPLPASDEKQWRCELLKSEFRLARSRCLDALLVDRVHGRPIAAITLEPLTWTQMRDGASIPFSSRGPRSDSDKSGGATTTNAANTGSSNEQRREMQASGDESSLPFCLPASAQEVVQRTVYAVTSFSHYVAPLWRHLSEEKAVLVDMDRTLVDNIITVHSLAERQRHLIHLNRAVAAAEGKHGARNPCVLWSSQLRRPSAARFSAPPFQFGQNDALFLSYEEALWRERCAASVSESDRVPASPSHQQPAGARPAPTDAAQPSHPPSSCSTPPSSTQTDAHRNRKSCHKTWERKGEGLLHAFLNRTATQREALGTLHYEECGAISYAAGALHASHRAGEATKRSDGGARWAPAAATAASAGTSNAKSHGGTALRASSIGGSAERSTDLYSDLIYVRPGIRQFLYRIALQWNIPVVVVTKSTRSRTEAILHNVLDPHRILFSNPQSCVVTADEMLCAQASLDASNNTSATLPNDVSSTTAGTREGAEEDERETHGQQHVLGDHFSSTAPATIAERITRCHKSIVQVLQCVLDAAALHSARRAWQEPPWCNLLDRLPKPRSVAVLDDAPQVWEKRDWPCTVSISPYTLSRIDPLPYFSPQGFISALVLSCLYGSKCLVCCAGACHVGAAVSPTVPRGQDPRQASPAGEGGVPRSQLSALTQLGPERWPHCICVCPPDHLDDIALAEEGGWGDPYAFCASDAASNVRAMIAELVRQSSESGETLRRLRPLLLPAVGQDASVVDEGRAPGLVKSAAARRIGTSLGDISRTQSSLYDSFHSLSTEIERRDSDAPNEVGDRSASIFEDIEPLPPREHEDDVVVLASSRGNVERHERTLKSLSTTPNVSPYRATVPPNTNSTQEQSRKAKVASGGGARHGVHHLLPLATDLSSSATPPSSRSSSSSSSSAAASSLTGSMPRELIDSPYYQPSAAAGASVPATPNSFCSLPDPWLHDGCIADTPTAAVAEVATRGVEDVAVDVLAGGVGDARGLGGAHVSPKLELAGGIGSEKRTVGADSIATNYGNVELAQLVEPSRKGLDVPGLTKKQYTPTTATRGGATRSSSNNAEVEDVIPLDMQPALSASGKRDSNGNIGSSGFAVDREEGAVSPPRIPVLIATVPSAEPTSSPFTERRMIAVSSNASGSALTSGTVEDVETITPQLSSFTPQPDTGEVCEGMLLRPLRRRVDDPQDTVEDIVPL